jgi:peptide/nickel transport system permease protein
VTSLARRIAKRASWSAVVVWATVTIAFLVNNALPSDPARMVAGQQAPAAAVAKVREQVGLDRPLYVQYGRFLGRLVHFGPSDLAPAKEPAHADCANLGPLHFDLGRSYQQRRPVVTILGERLPRTFLLAFAAALVQALIGITAGVLAAANKRKLVDHMAVTGSLLGISAPTFIIGLFLQWLFAYELRLLPLDGYGTTTGEHLASLVLPALTLGLFGAAYYTRIVRDEMISELGQDYIRTARAKGLGMASVVSRHALRNALVPIVTIFGLEVGTLVGGAIVTESVFRWPGLGSLSATALLDRDGPVVMGCVIVTSGIVVLSTLAVDLAYAALDPRTRRAR